MPILLEFPLSVVQGTHLPCFEPSGDAVEMKSMITDSPRNSTLFGSSRRLVGLTFNAKIHNVVPADGTVINHNIPGPEGYCIPLFHFKALLARAAVGAAGGIHIHRCRHFGNTLSITGPLRLRTGSHVASGSPHQAPPPAPLPLLARAVGGAGPVATPLKGAGGCSSPSAGE